MPQTLSELLERIRPAGTPGAPSEGEGDREQNDQDREIGPVVRALAMYEAEANQIIAAAHDRAAQIRTDGALRSERIQAGLPTRIADAQTAADRHRRDEAEEDRARLASDAAGEVARLDSVATERIDALVERAVALIWSAIPGAPHGQV